jgi:predicted nucleic acid-binding protein
VRKVILADSGPLVAFLSERDRFHQWARQQFADISGPVVTCEAVLTEAFFLLGHHRPGVEALLRLVESGLVRVGFSLADEAEPIRKLVARYANVPMSLADACLVRMTEIHSRSRVLTIDSDFLIYRRHGRQTIPLIMPPR